MIWDDYRATALARAADARRYPALDDIDLVLINAYATVLDGRFLADSEEYNAAKLVGHALEQLRLSRVALECGLSGQVYPNLRAALEACVYAAAFLKSPATYKAWEERYFPGGKKVARNTLGFSKVLSICEFDAWLSDRIQSVYEHCITSGAHPNVSVVIRKYVDGREDPFRTHTHSWNDNHVSSLRGAYDLYKAAETCVLTVRAMIGRERFGQLLDRGVKTAHAKSLRMAAQLNEIDDLLRLSIDGVEQP